MRVVVADTDIGYRLWIRRVLESGKEWRVVGEATEAEEALRLISRYDPEMVVVDIDLPMRGGVDLARRVKAMWPQKLVVMCSLSDTAARREAANRSGADEFLPKISPLSGTLGLLAQCRKAGSHLAEPFTALPRGS